MPDDGPAPGPQRRAREAAAGAGRRARRAWDAARDTARSPSARRSVRKRARAAWDDARAHPLALGAGWAAGAAVFRGALAGLNAAAHALRVSTHTPAVVAWPLAAAGVALAGAAASDAMNAAWGAARLPRGEAEARARRAARAWLERPREEAAALARAATRLDTRERRFYAAASVLATAALCGGRLARLLPSDLRRRGAFARGSLPDAPYMAYADKRARRKVQVLGRRHGCHHCGRRAGPAVTGGRFVADHIPPNKYASGPRTRQRFYPQCDRCCGLQAAAVANDVRKLVTHRGHRAYHLFLPLPLAWLVLQGALDEWADRATEGGGGGGWRAWLGGWWGWWK